MFFKIYKTTNLINGKIYVGQTHYDRQKYFGSGTLISEAIEKYGIENFVKEYIDDASSQEELDIKEIYWIKELKSQDREIGYNIADGGWYYFTMTDETKEKISKTLKGKYVGEQAFRKGLKLTDEHKKAISKALKGRILTSEHRQKISEGGKGKRPADTTRKKMSMSHKGKILTAEHRQKISEGGKGKTYTEEQKEKLRSANLNKTQLHSRTVTALCIQLNMEIKFNNISEAARHFKVTRHKIKHNLVPEWQFIVNDPIVSIKNLKNNNYASESTSNT